MSEEQIERLIAILDSIDTRLAEIAADLSRVVVPEPGRSVDFYLRTRDVGRHD